MSDLRKGGLCPACEKGRLRVTKKDLIFTYKSESKSFKSQKVYGCNLCDYEALTRNDNRRIEKALTDFRRSVDGLLSSDQLRRIRESLHRNKKQMAKLLSVNEKTIGRYENGKITQSEQTDKLYRILAAYPVAAKSIDSEKHLFEFKATELSKYNPYHFLGPNYIFAADDHSNLEGDEHAKAA